MWRSDLESRVPGQLLPAAIDQCRQTLRCCRRVSPFLVAIYIYIYMYEEVGKGGRASLNPRPEEKGIIVDSILESRVYLIARYFR